MGGGGVGGEQGLWMGGRTRHGVRAGGRTSAFSASAMSPAVRCACTSLSFLRLGAPLTPFIGERTWAFINFLWVGLGEGWCGVWYGMVGMVWYMVWYGMVWYRNCKVWYEWYGMVRYVWYGTVRCGMVWYGMVCGVGRFGGTSVWAEAVG